MIPSKKYEYQNNVKSNTIGEIEIKPTDVHFLYFVALNVCASVDGYIKDPLFELVSSIDNRIQKSQFSFKGYTDAPI